jgi:D-alanine--D-alanine ligase
MSSRPETGEPVVDLRRTVLVTGAPAAKRVVWADTAKGACILLVVLWHVVMKHYLQIDWKLSVPLPGAWGTLGEQLLPLRMPLFFAVSGIFAVNAVGRPWRVLGRSKVARFFYLYALWLFIHTMLLAVVDDFDTARAGDALELLEQLTITPSNLWYLYALALYFAVAKVVRGLPTGRVLVVAFLLSAVASAELLPTPGDRGEVMQNLLFFLAGVRLRPVLERLATARDRQQLALTGGILVVALAAMELTGSREWFGVRPAVSAVSVVFGVTAAAYLAGWSAVSRPLATLGSRTLPVYVIHMPVLALLHQALISPLSNLDARWQVPVAVAEPVILTAVVVASCLALETVLRKAGAAFLFDLPGRRHPAPSRPAPSRPAPSPALDAPTVVLPAVGSPVDSATVELPVMPHRTSTELRVAVLFGGRSSEHEVSCASAASVVRYLDRQRYDVTPVRIDLEGRWTVGTDTPEPASLDVRTLVDLTRPGPGTPTTALASMWTALEQLRHSVDVVFPVLHGRYGEDGTVQSVLELAGIPYVGSGVLASAAGLSKDMTKKLLAGAGLTVTRGVVLDEYSEPVSRAEWDQLGLPVFVKPAGGGSSIGVSKVEDWSQLDEAVALARTSGRKVLVESAVAGREVDVGVLQYPGGSVVAGPPLEIRIADGDGFFSYEAKYRSRQTVFDVPARLPAEVTGLLQAQAVEAFHVLGCSGLLRVDFFLPVDAGGHLRPVLNEVNTMPGFTAVSQYPRIWAAAGIEYPDLLDVLIETALAGKRRPVLAAGREGVC